MATRAVVQAQLVIDGKSYGPHIFVSPIRPLSKIDWLLMLMYKTALIDDCIGDHKPLSSVQVGDIGPKAYGGFASMVNCCKLKIDRSS